MAYPHLVALGLSLLVLLSLGLITLSNYQMTVRAIEASRSTTTTTTTTTTAATTTTVSSLTVATCNTANLDNSQGNLLLTFSQTGAAGTLTVTGTAFGSAALLLVNDRPTLSVSTGSTCPASAPFAPPSPAVNLPALTTAGVLRIPSQSVAGFTLTSGGAPSRTIVSGDAEPLLLGSAIALYRDGVLMTNACCEVTAGL
ncbi:cell wall integrity and stress response component 4-like [Pollicipes pollicipes]|uniref:cell wall integrity and stress response component 4-like n=1 Tax=Pollicipes pollicipes TaxID=41117 RepID=UPI0018856765|nr:cell wall integrity and stress response component 4-like [Pollicipes pollicipes]